jgi:hypothetical protein
VVAGPVVAVQSDLITSIRYAVRVRRRPPD